MHISQGENKSYNLGTLRDKMATFINVYGYLYRQLKISTYLL